MGTLNPVTVILQSTTGKTPPVAMQADYVTMNTERVVVQRNGEWRSVFITAGGFTLNHITYDLLNVENVNVHLLKNSIEGLIIL
jgi:hypothetical protein